MLEKIILPPKMGGYSLGILETTHICDIGNGHHEATETDEQQEKATTLEHIFRIISYLGMLIRLLNDCSKDLTWKRCLIKVP